MEIKVEIPIDAETLAESIQSEKDIEWLGKVLSLLDADEQAAVIDEMRKHVGGEYSQGMQFRCIAEALHPDTKSLLKSVLCEDEK